MVDTTILGVGIAFLVVAALLLVHHWHKHRPDGDDPLKYPDRCFQKSDVCNFHSCSHEMWIMALSLVAAVLILFACFA